MQKQAAEIDTYARANIKDYKKLSSPAQSQIRRVIEDGRAKGVSDSDVLAYAKVAAHSGLDIVFSKEATRVDNPSVTAGRDTSLYTKEAKYADGYYDASRNLVVINPESTRSAERLLIHELDHAITNVYGRKGRKAVAKMYKTALEGVDESVKKHILAKYGGDLFTSTDEINSYYAEKVLTNRYTLEKLLEAEPTLKDKILSFFKGASADYADVPKLSGAAKKYYRTYKKLFDEFSARNAENNAMEPFTNKNGSNVNENGVSDNVRTTDDNNMQVSGIKYALKIGNSLSENVDSVLSMSDAEAKKNKTEGNFVSVMQNTPDVILNNVKDAENLEIIMRFDSFYLATRHSGALEGHYHNYGEIMKELPKIISDPLAIVRMDNGRLNLLSSVETSKGKYSIVSVELNTIKDINSKNEKYNMVISVIPSNDNYMKNNLNNHAVKVEYTKEDLPQVNHQLYEWLATVNERSSKISIPQPEQKSNGSGKKSSEKSSGKQYALDIESENVRLRAEWEGDTVFSEKTVEETLYKKIEQFKYLKKSVRDEIIHDLWRGLNESRSAEER